jgi:hypothetical protein
MTMTRADLLPFLQKHRLGVQSTVSPSGDPQAAVVGWDEEITVQLEGIADEPTGAERDRILDAYFAVYPECRDHLAWTGITHFRVRPTWIRYSNFNAPQQSIEFT